MLIPETPFIMTANEYMTNVPADRKNALDALRSLILDTFPDVEENMGYNMPTYLHKGETLCSIANQKNYMALYIMPYDLLDEFKDELATFNCGASCIRFKKLKEGDLDLFKRILTYCDANYYKSQYFGRMNAGKK